MEIANFSNAGERVDIFAPGTDIYSTTENSKYGKKSGTSMATPHISGVAAMVWSANNNLTGAQVKETVCRRGSLRCRSCKMVDAYMAVEHAVDLRNNNIPEQPNSTKGTIMSFVVQKNNEDIVITNANIVVTNTKTHESFTAVTDNKGHFEIIVPKGKYYISVSADDYCDYNSESIITVNGNDVVYTDWIKLTRLSPVSGYVYNNINGSQEYNEDTWIGIPGVTITVKEDVSGEGLHSLDDKTTITDSNGHYDIRLPAGRYEIEASHPTYGTQSISNVIIYDNEITEAEWIVFNGKFSGTTLRIPGEEPIHTYNSNAEWAWTAYDHPNYDTSSGYDKHIIIDGKNIKMDGYLQAGYKDFLFVDGENSTRKVFELDFQRDQTSRYDSEYNWHSMYGGGFLFNTSINEEENTISGYYILITQSGPELFKVDNMAIDTFRNSERRGERLSTFKFDDRFDRHHIKIDVSSNSVSLYDGETLVIDDYTLTDNYGNGFGPITSHIRHYCEQRSYFTFSNITMQTM